MGIYTEKFSLISQKNLGVVYGMTDKHQENRQLLYRFQRPIFSVLFLKK